MVERGGAARAFSIPVVTGKNIRDKLVTNASRKSRLHTDESKLYAALGAEFAQHAAVNHFERNRYVHDIWVAHDDGAGAVKVDTTRRIKKDQESGEHFVQQWKHKYVTIDEVAT